jgi:hypothetical protein
MATLVAYLNARPISTRFHIRVATMRAVHVMREPTGINLPAGARSTSTLNWHTDSLRLFDGQVTVPDGPTSDVRALPLGIGS